MISYFLPGRPEFENLVTDIIIFDTLFLRDWFFLSSMDSEIFGK